MLQSHATRLAALAIERNLAEEALRNSWNVAAGRWAMRAGSKADGSDLGAATSLQLERSAATDLSFAPRTTTVFDFILEAPGEDPSTRPDLGIGMDDVSLKGRALTVIVHSLGSAAAPGGTLFLEDSSGRTVTSTKIAALAAPTDLQPKKARVRLSVPAGAAVETQRARVDDRDRIARAESGVEAIAGEDINEGAGPARDERVAFLDEAGSGTGWHERIDVEARARLYLLRQCGDRTGEHQHYDRSGDRARAGVRLAVAAAVTARGSPPCGGCPRAGRRSSRRGRAS